MKSSEEKREVCWCALMSVLEGLTSQMYIALYRQTLLKTPVSLYTGLVGQPGLARVGRLCYYSLHMKTLSSTIYNRKQSNSINIIYNSHNIYIFNTNKSLRKSKHLLKLIGIIQNWLKRLLYLSLEVIKNMRYIHYNYLIIYNLLFYQLFNKLFQLKFIF